MFKDFTDTQLRTTIVALEARSIELSKEIKSFSTPDLVKCLEDELLEINTLYNRASMEKMTRSKSRALHYSTNIM